METNGLFWWTERRKIRSAILRPPVGGTHCRILQTTGQAAGGCIGFGSNDCRRWRNAACGGQPHCRPAQRAAHPSGHQPGGIGASRSRGGYLELELGAARAGGTLGRRRGAGTAHKSLPRCRRARPVFLRPVLLRAHRFAHHSRHQRFRATGSYRYRRDRADVPGHYSGRHPLPHRMAHGPADVRLHAIHFPGCAGIPCHGAACHQTWHAGYGGCQCGHQGNRQRHLDCQELPPGKQHLRRPSTMPISNPIGSISDAVLSFRWSSPRSMRWAASLRQYWFMWAA